jgi:hypothetical protein
MLMVGLDIAPTAAFPGLLAIEDSMRAAIGAGDRVHDFTIGDHPTSSVSAARQSRSRCIRAHRSRPCCDIGIARARAKRKLMPLLSAHRHCGEGTGRAGLTRTLSKAKETTLTAR